MKHAQQFGNPWPERTILVIGVIDSKEQKCPVKVKVHTVSYSMGEIYLHKDTEIIIIIIIHFIYKAPFRALKVAVQQVKNNRLKQLMQSQIKTKATLGYF